MSKKNIGIDFGTTFSAISYLDDERGVVYFENGKSTFPTEAISVPNRGLYFGKEVHSVTMKSDALYRGFKVLLSDKLDDRLKKMHYSSANMPKDITRGFLEHMFRKYKQDENIDALDSVTLTVPFIWMNNYVDSKNRQILKNECRKALTKVFGNKSSDIVIDLLAEPNAAALYCAHVYKKSQPDHQTYKLLVIDYGGGTLDISLCDVSQVNGNPHVSILGSPWGAGMNTEHEMGKAGMAFQQKVIIAALKAHYGEDFDFEMDADFWLAMSSLENTLINGRDTDENIKSLFYTKPNDKDLDKEFTSFGHKVEREKPDKSGRLTEYNYIKITYRMLRDAFYSDEISGVLARILRNDEKTGVIDYLETNQINYRHNADFKIALVGGFCNFYLTQKQIYEAFELGEMVEDPRIFRLTNRERTSAVCFGAALRKTGLVHYEISAQYSLGLFVGHPSKPNEERDRLYWGIRYGEKIKAKEKYWIRFYDRATKTYVRNPSAFISASVEYLAVHHYPRPDEAVVLPLNIDNLKEKLNDPDDKRAYYNIGFSYDESEFIFIHVRKVYYDEKRQEYLAKAGEEDNAKSIELGSIGDIQGMRSINDYRKIKEEGIENA